MKNIKKRLIGWTLGLALSLGVGIGIASNTHSEIARVEAAETKVTVNFGTDAIKVDKATVTANDSAGNAWTITTTGTTSFTPNKNYCQIGKKDAPATEIILTSTLNKNYKITGFSSKWGGFKGTAGNISMKVGETGVATGQLNATNDVTVTQAGETSGNVLTISVTGIAKGVKLYSLSYSYGTNESLTAKSVTINPAKLTITEGEIGYTKQLSALVAYNESAETNDNVTWSSDSKQATVSTTGLLTLKSASGSAKITATSKALGTDGQPVSATLNVTWSGLVEPTSVIFSKKGFTNGQEIKEVDINGVIKVIFNKGTNENSPKYYTTGEAVRIYPGGYFRVSVTDASKRLVSISLGFGSGDYSNEITTDNPSFTSPVWTGNAQGVTFSVRGSKDHRRIASITVTYEDFADTSATDALAFGTLFLNTTATPCTDGTKDNSGALKTIWATLKTEFNALSDDAKKLVKGAVANNAGTDLEKAMARYDHIVKRYSAIHAEINDFIGRGVTASLTNQLFKANTTNNIMVISTIACVSAAAIGSFFFIRKRKEQN